MYEFYQIRVRDAVLKRARKDLRNIYDDIPETNGCLDNLASCQSWCCQHQSPSVLYSEFLNTYWHINHTWPQSRLAKLFIEAARIYITNKPTKGCVFWDKESKLCQQHFTRPFNCRTYGQIPEEDFKPRYERLKVLYENRPDAVIKEQCNLVRTVGDRPTSKQIDEWFEQLKFVERDVLGEPYTSLRGLTKQHTMIHDGDGGSYRTYHDHLLLQMAPITMLERLTDLRNTGTEEEKEAFIAGLEADLENELNGTGNSKSNQHSLPTTK